MVVVVVKNNWCSGEREWRGCSSRELWVLAGVWWVASSGAAGCWAGERLDREWMKRKFGKGKGEKRNEGSGTAFTEVEST